MLQLATTSLALAMTIAATFPHAVAPPAAGGGAAEAPRQARYGLVLLRSGVRPEISRAVAEGLQAGHMANIRRMADGGGLVAAGPLADASAYRGVFVFVPESLASLPRLLDPDPIVRAGRLVPEPWLWTAEPGIGEDYRRRAATASGSRDSMVSFSLVLLRQGPGWSANATPGLERLLARQRRVLERQRTAGQLVLSGPVEGAGSLRCVYVYATDTTRARALVSLDPAVGAGRLVPEIHSWWTAYGVVPGH